VWFRPFNWPISFPWRRLENPSGQQSGDLTNAVMEIEILFGLTELGIGIPVFREHNFVHYILRIIWKSITVRIADRVQNRMIPALSLKKLSATFHSSPFSYAPTGCEVRRRQYCDQEPRPLQCSCEVVSPPTSRVYFFLVDEDPRRVIELVCEARAKSWRKMVVYPAPDVFFPAVRDEDVPLIVSNFEEACCPDVRLHGLTFFPSLSQNSDHVAHFGATGKFVVARTA
jgi:hypothetical protein